MINFELWWCTDYSSHYIVTISFCFKLSKNIECESGPLACRGKILLELTLLCRETYLIIQLVLHRYVRRSWHWLRRNWWPAPTSWTVVRPKSRSWKRDKKHWRKIWRREMRNSNSRRRLYENSRSSRYWQVLYITDSPSNLNRGCRYVCTLLCMLLTSIILNHSVCVRVCRSWCKKN